MVATLTTYLFAISKGLKRASRQIDIVLCSSDELIPLGVANSSLVFTFNRVIGQNALIDEPTVRSWYLNPFDV